MPAPLKLRRFRPAPPLSLRRFGPDGRLSALAPVQTPSPIAAVVGPPGAQGEQGLQGVQGAPQRIDFSSAATWIAAHGLGRSPAVLVYLTTGERVLADYVATPINVTVTHAQARAGFILLI
jgi:hypothetical protein